MLEFTYRINSLAKREGWQVYMPTQNWPENPGPCEAFYLKDEEYSEIGKPDYINLKVEADERWRI